MKIHHLNCGTLCPYGGKLVNRSPARIVCHCLLVETNKELILIDSGLGTRDVENPKRLGFIRHLLKGSLNPVDTAAFQVKKLGFKLSDVRHIIVTHLDLDHAGGIADFPNAKIHIFKREYEISQNPNSFFERERYRKCHFDHSPNWVIHNPDFGENWFGFNCVRELEGLPPEILLIPLPGHTDGHCGIAVKANTNWILNAGDSYYDYRQMDLKQPQCSLGLSLFQKIVHTDKKMCQANLIRLRELKEKANDEIKIHCAHDPHEFEVMSKTLLL